MTAPIVCAVVAFLLPWALAWPVTTHRAGLIGMDAAALGVALLVALGLLTALGGMSPWWLLAPAAEVVSGVLLFATAARRARYFSGGRR